MSSKNKKEDNEVVYKAYCLVAENKNQHWHQDLAIKEALFIIENYDLKVEVNLSGQFLSSKSNKLSEDEYAVPIRIAATKEGLNDISIDWCVCGSEVDELDLGNIVRWWPRKWLFGEKQTMPEHIRIDYGIVSKKHLILDLEVVTDVSKTILEKSFGDIVTEAEIGELKRIELSKMNLKTENRVNKNAVVVEEVKEIQEVGEDMSLFKKNKKTEEEKQETISEVENTAADEALDASNEQSFVHEFVPPADTVETTEVSTEEAVENENTEIKNDEVHEEENMNETTQTQQQETAPAPRKRLTTKRVVVTTGIILGAATLITTGVVCWKKFHK
jgi:hypothetical protein